MSDGPLAGLGLRVASAVVMAAIVIAAVMAGRASFALLVGAMALVLVWEWTRMTGGGRFGATGGVLGAATLAVIGAATALSPLAAVPVAVAAAAGLLIFARFRAEGWSPWLALGPIYIGLPCAALIWLRAVEPNGGSLVLWLLATVWAADSMAYFAGRLIGGPKLAPRLSPRKTWAGLGGALAGGALVAAGAAAWIEQAPPVAPLVAAGLTIALVEQAGDLVESAFKRHFGLKDASGLIPGHGGLFDRVDGLLVAAPVLALWHGLDPSARLGWG